MNTQNKMILGFAAAALAGVGIAMLLAPEKSKEVRDKLREGSNTIAKKLLNVVQSNGEALRDKAGEFIDDTKGAYNQAKGYAKSEVDHLEDKVRKAV